MRSDYRHLPLRRFPPGVWLGGLVLRLLRWRIEGELPDVPKLLVVAAPHTSNWDWVIGMAAALFLDLDANWLGKDTLFRTPLGPLLKWLGGVSVDRNHPHGVIAQIVAECRRRERFLLGVAPEATRKPNDRWRSGCHYIARDADIPLVPVRIDYSRRAIEIGEILQLAPDAEGTLDRISGWYRPQMAKFSEKFRRHRSGENTSEQGRGE